MIRRFCIIIVALGYCLTTEAQQNPYNEVSIASPTAASLGKYADIPVNFHTGVPDISIPIYSVKEGPLSLPISLSYHASGLKVMETAGWVGAGWSLNAGGVITRTVRGAPDERGTSNVDGQVDGHFSDYGYSNYTVYDGGGSAIQDFYYGKRDGEPDLFSFNVGSYSGKFYFRDDRTPIFEPQQDIKVDYVYTGVGSIQSFVLTTPDGTKYYFGVTADGTDVDPIERTNTVNGQVGYTAGTVISSWYLNKIESSDSVFSIKLNYAAENYSYFTNSMFPLASGDNTSFEYNLIKNVVTGVRLTSVVFSNGRVDFTANTVRQDLSDASTQFADAINAQAKALDAIQITDSTTLCKKYLLYYSYFTDNAALTGYYSSYGLTTDAKRLKLDSIKETSCDGTIILPPHTFSYFSEKVARRLSFGQDYWGFYNGVDNNSKLIPTYTENKFTQFLGANRDPAWPAMRGGTLKRIIYPTGGYTDFDFEGNDTWASSPAYNNGTQFSMSMGYDGNSAEVVQNQTLTVNPYTVSLHNSTTGGLGTVTVYSGTTVIYTLSANAGETKVETVQLGSGTYSIHLLKNPLIGTAHGVDVSFTEQIPYTYSRNQLVGGLRIKTITHHDTVSNQNLVTSYSYVDANGHSTGILYSRPVYVEVIRSDQIAEAGVGGPNGHGPPINSCNPNGCLNCDISTTMFYQKSPCGIRPLSTSQGNHIGYDQVKVSQAGNGYTLYMYYGSDHWDTVANDVAIRDVYTKSPCNPSILSYPHVPYPFEPKRGQLKYEGYFSESGQLLKQIYHYLDYAQDSATTLGKIDVYGPNVSNWFFGTHYQINPVRKTSDSTVEYDLSPTGQYLTTKTENFYESKYHNQVTRTQLTNSKGEILQTKYKYSSDFRPACDTLSDCFRAYNNAVISVTASYYSAKAACGTDGCIWLNYQDYVQNLDSVRMIYVSCRRTNFTDPTNTTKTCLANAKTAAGTELKPIYELRDANRVIPIEASSWWNNQLTNASFYRYDYSTNPATKVYINTIKKINLASPSASFTNAAVSGTTITKDSRYKDESFYTFNAGSPTQATGHDGIVNSYIWDYHNTEPIAKIAGAATSVIAYTSFEADGKGNWTFSSTPGTDYTAPTGKKIYTLTGSNNITKSGLTSSATYVISYWTKNSTAYTITGTISGYPISGRTVNGWKYFEHRITGQTTATITGSGTIDELRLYPVMSLMMTYTYDPVKGMTSQCDANNRISYYEYDGVGRLSLVRDQDRNIIKKICYNYQGQQEVCGVPIYFSVLKSGNFTRNNCTSGYTGTTVTYSVAANTYSSYVSQAAADQLAQNDVNANGQNYANANGACTTTCSVTILSGFTNVTSSSTASLSAAGNNGSFSLVFKSATGSTNWSTFNNIATVGTLCRPSTTRTLPDFSSGGATWRVKVAIDGTISAEVVGGTAPTGFTVISLSGSYAL